MFKVTYKQYHLPQLCNCKYHKNDVFLNNENTAEFLTLLEAVREISQWNRLGVCWQYAILKVEQE